MTRSSPRPNGQKLAGAPSDEPGIDARVAIHPNDSRFTTERTKDEGKKKRTISLSYATHVIEPCTFTAEPIVQNNAVDDRPEGCHSKPTLAGVWVHWIRSRSS